MTKIQKKQLAILKDTIKWYTEDVTRRAIAGNGNGVCKYYMRPKGRVKRCAIGRLVSLEDAICMEKKWPVEGVYSPGTDGYSLYDDLPKDIQALGVEFLRNLQSLHDAHSFWNDSGLSEKGAFFVDSIKDRIKFGQYSIP